MTMYLPLIVMMASSSNSIAELKVAKIGDTVVDASALTIKGGFGQSINGLSFQQDAVATHGEYQYVGYYGGKRQVCMARRKLPAGNWQIIRFKDYEFRSNDAHNTISIGICPRDGTIHLAFDHHGHPLHYRVSQRGAATMPEAVKWDASLFGPVASELEKGKSIRITYPRFWQTQDRGLQFCYRRGGSGNGDRMLVDYDPSKGVWVNTRQIDSGRGLFRDAMGKSTSRCSYPNGYDYGPLGRLHATWVWHSQAVDSHGRIHVVMWHCSLESLAAANSKPGEHRWGPPAARRYHHYWRDENGKWEHTELPGVAGNRPKIFTDRKDNVYMIFRNADLFLHSGDLVIAAASAISKWTDWKLIHTEKGPFVNEMLYDPYRWKTNGILSVMVQGAPEKAHDATSLRILDFATR